jgi:oligoribonuclease NrnB/cAMP/cGMP phosphodiesterase (DHH superfamily)
MLFHLSHTDLDGYGCQIVTKHYFKEVVYYNSGYGAEINEKLKIILQSIFLNNYKKATILISDLNLTLDQAKFLTKEVEKLPNDVEIILLDHHKSGEDVANRYKWYHLDVNRCATKITYDYFSKQFGADAQLGKFVDIVDAVDIWQTEKEEFETGKILMSTVAGVKEINKVMFPDDQRALIFSILESAYPYFDELNPHIAIDDRIHGMKKSFFRDQEDNTLDNLVANYVVKLLSQNKKRMTIEYNGHKGLLSYNVGNVSVIGNGFLVANSEYDFFMDVTGKKTISLRANGAIDVSKMASEVANGGGHANAAGGVLNEFKDSFIYDTIKSQVDRILKKD